MSSTWTWWWEAQGGVLCVYNTFVLEKKCTLQCQIIKLLLISAKNSLFIKNVYFSIKKTSIMWVGNWVAFLAPTPRPSLAYPGHLPHFYGCNLESSRSYAATWNHSREWDECPMLSSLVHICAICYQREAWPRRMQSRAMMPGCCRYNQCKFVRG